MDVTSAGTQTATFQQRIDALRETKVAHTAIKLQRRGYFDIDDHGYIPWAEPIPFERKSNHPSGGCYGAACIGENFRAWLEVHPVYIHPTAPWPAPGWVMCRAWAAGAPRIAPPICALCRKSTTSSTPASAG